MPRGATKQFDREETLDRAMHLFWEQGFEATGLAQLLERMDIGRQSLYDTFGSKRDLFFEALDHYFVTRLGTVGGMLEKPGSPLANVREVLHFYEDFCGRGDGMGCLLVNTLTESGGYDESFRAVVQQKVQLLEGYFRRTFDRAKQENELLEDAEPRALARSMLAFAAGINVMARIGAKKSMIRDAVRMQLRLIDSVAQRR